MTRTVEQYHNEVTELLEQVRSVVDVVRSASTKLEDTDVNPRSVHGALWRAIDDIDSTTKLVDEWFSLNMALEIS